MKQLEPIYCDVLVAGGGAAGIAAAVSAARKGASVILLEKNGFLGGKASAAYVSTICGLYYRSQELVANYVADGFMMEFSEKLKALSNTNPIGNKHGLFFLPYKPFDFKILADTYIQEEKINVYFHTSISGVHCVDSKIDSIEAISYDRKITIKPKAVVDCSGEAIVSVLAGSDYIETDVYQASAQVFSMEGVQSSSESNLGLILMKEVQKAIFEEKLSEEYASVSIVPGSLFGTQVYLKIGIPIQIQNETNKISSVELYARKMILQLSDFLVKNIEAFKFSRIADIAPEVGVRTGRRHQGKYILTKEDILGLKKVSDSVAKGAWPIEYWDLGKRVKMEFFDFEKYYDIPSGCLASASILNLFFAGRNISATEEAIASARVIGTCFQTGFSAGEMATNSF